MQDISITEALHERMTLIAEAMTKRVAPGYWAGYTAQEELKGRYTKPPELGYAPTLEYSRYAVPQAQIVLAFLKMVEVKEVYESKPAILQEGIREFQEFDLEFYESEHEKEIEHTFEKTASFAEGKARAWETTAKASLSDEYADTDLGALQALDKYGQNLKQQISPRDRDSIRRTILFTGPSTVRLRAERHLNRESRTYRVRCDFDGVIYFIGAEDTWKFATFKTQFLPIAKRTADDDSASGHQAFIDKPMPDFEIAKIETPSDKVIEFVSEYDVILTQSLKEI